MNTGIYIFCSFILVIIGYIIIHSKIPKPTLKAIGQIGTGVLATLGGIDTGLSLYDRGKEYLESKKSKSSGDSSSDNSNDNENTDDKNNDGNTDNNKDANKNDNTSSTDNDKN